MKGAILFCVLFAAVFVSTNANKDGFITVNNRGGYISFFVVDYTHNGKAKHEESNNFTPGNSKTIPIPAGATDVQVKVKFWWFLGAPSTLFTHNYPGPVEKCFNIGGTTLNPTYEEIRC